MNSPYYYYTIENADATPPHLEVTLRLVRSDGVQGSLQFFAFWVAQLIFVNYTCAHVYSLKGPEAQPSLVMKTP